MYIALISAHALGLSGMHFFTCIKAQWNGKNFLPYETEYSTMTNIQQTVSQTDKVITQFTAAIYLPAPLWIPFLGTNQKMKMKN